jgi:hypothetical protein
VKPAGTPSLERKISPAQQDAGVVQDKTGVVQDKSNEVEVVEQRGCWSAIC